MPGKRESIPDRISFALLEAQFELGKEIGEVWIVRQAPTHPGKIIENASRIALKELNLRNEGEITPEDVVQVLHLILGTANSPEVNKLKYYQKILADNLLITEAVITMAANIFAEPVLTVNGRKPPYIQGNRSAARNRIIRKF